jgi:hypothetical protein
VHHEARSRWLHRPVDAKRGNPIDYEYRTFKSLLDALGQFRRWHASLGSR